MSRNQKSEMLKRCWVPNESYNFRDDSNDNKRRFIYSWLEMYKPWLVYSKQLKGALCLYCVLFPPTLPKGILGAFIATAFTRYKSMHEQCKSHMASGWHKNAVLSAKNFTEAVPVNTMLVSGHQKLIDENRKILSSIISLVIFCGSHDLPLRGKETHGGKSGELLIIQLFRIVIHYIFFLCFRVQSL